MPPTKRAPRHAMRITIHPLPPEERCSACHATGTFRRINVPALSDHSDVDRFGALAARSALDLYVLAVFQAAVAGALDVREVHEQVGAVWPGDEPVSLVVVEELDGTGGHRPSLLVLHCKGPTDTSPWPERVERALTRGR